MAGVPRSLDLIRQVAQAQQVAGVDFLIEGNGRNFSVSQEGNFAGRQVIHGQKAAFFFFLEPSLLHGLQPTIGPTPDVHFYLLIIGRQRVFSGLGRNGRG